MTSAQRHRSYVAILCVIASLGCLVPQNRRAQQPPVEEPYEQEQGSSDEDSPQAPPAAGQVQALSARREATVSFVWFRGHGEEAEGGASPVTIRVEPNTGAQVAVGVMEEYSGGAGSMWRSSAWIAAFTATQLLGHRLGDYEFLVKSGGMVDGPSASMLVTATMMALLRGDALRPQTTMTGTVNPDGTCGPVGGIVQKMEGARKAGLTRFGYPVGLRQHQDHRTGKMEDLQQVAQRLGMEVVEINDVYDAYLLLTGVRLPRPQPAAEVEMAPDVEQVERMKKRHEIMTQEVVARAKITGQRLSALPEAARASLNQSFIQPALKELEAVDRWVKNGDYQAAYYYLVRAWMWLETANKQMPFWTFLSSANRQSLQAYVQGLDEAPQALGELQKLLEKSLERSTLGGQVNTTYALTTYIMGVSMVSMGQLQIGSQAGQAALQQLQSGALTPNRQNIDTLIKLFISPTVFFAGAQASAYLGSIQLLMGAEQGQRQASSQQLGKLTQAYRSAASANLAYFDSLVIEPLSKSAGLSADVARERFAQQDMSYALAWQATVRAMNMREAEGPARMIALAAAVNGFMGTSELIYKYYSLQASTDERSGQLVLTYRKALTVHLDLARARAREAAGDAKRRLGYIPEATKAEYSLALALRDGDDEDKLNALTGFWMATFWSELALALGQ